MSQCIITVMARLTFNVFFAHKLKLSMSVSPVVTLNDINEHDEQFSVEYTRQVTLCNPTSL